MNTKLQLLIIAAIAIFSLSWSLSSIKDDNERIAKAENKEYIARSTEEQVNPLKGLSDTKQEVITPIPPIKPTGSTEIPAYDDGAFHFFHFNRIKRLRKCVQNLCLFAKLFLIYTHASVLIMEFMHIIHH